MYQMIRLFYNDTMIRRVLVNNKKGYMVIRLQLLLERESRLIPYAT